MAKPSPEQLSAERKLFKRLVISHYDLEHAKRYAEIILNRNLHDSDEGDDRYLHQGLNVALVVSYWRPFSENEGAPDTLPRLPDRFIREFDSSEKALHNEVQRLRNKAFAHSDSEAHGVRVSVRDFLGKNLAMPTGWNAHLPFPRERTTRLLRMVEHLLAKMQEERLRIQELLPAGEAF